MQKAVALVCVSLLALLSAGVASGQAVYGNIVGTVVDESGAGLPNAKVTITDVSRAASFTTTTSESGFFTQRFLIAGRYQVRVEVEGFRAHVQDVSVSVDQETSLNVNLQVGQVSETVEVSGGAAAALQQNDSTVINTMNERTVLRLPNPNRSIEGMSRLFVGSSSNRKLAPRRIRAAI